MDSPPSTNPQPPPAPAPSSETEASPKKTRPTLSLLARPSTLIDWRRKVLVRVFKGAFWACAIILLVDLEQALRTGDYRFILPAGIALAGLSFVAFYARTPFALRTSIFVVLLFASVTEALFTNAFLAPNAFIISTTVTVLIALNVGQRAAWLTLALFLGGLALAAAHFLGGAPAPQTTLYDTSIPGNWFRVSTAFFIATGICLVAVSYLTKKLQGAVTEAFDLMRALRGENEEKVKALKKQSELETQLRQAEELENLGRLAGGVAHDFNNLLVVIINNAELLRRRSGLEGSRELAAIDEAGSRAAALIRQLLTFGAKHDEKTTNIDLNATLEGSLTLVRQLLPANVRLSFRPSPLLGSIIASRVDIEQLVLNLCVNARDAMPGGGRLYVETSPCQRKNPSRPNDNKVHSYARLRIMDTGEGISLDDQAHVFDAFFTTKIPGRGTGLGLSVVKRVVDSLGGFIGLNSIPGKGSEFVLHLPLVESQQAPMLPEESSRYAEGGDDTILVVDDEEAVRTVTAQLLEQVGYKVITCKDGSDALQHYERNGEQISLIVTDVMMPTVTGKDLYDIIHARGNSPPFVFCTGYSSNILPDGFFDDPGRTLVTKPFRAKELQSAVRTLLDQTSTS